MEDGVGLSRSLNILERAFAYGLRKVNSRLSSKMRTVGHYVYIDGSSSAI